MMFYVLVMTKLVSTETQNFKYEGIDIFLRWTKQTEKYIEIYKDMKRFDVWFP